MKAKKSVPVKKTAKASDIQIVVLQRGWVVVGRFAQNKSECKVTSGFVIRNWGTSKGLGELAESGPLSGTKLDPIPETTFHELTVVARMKCSGDGYGDGDGYGYGREVENGLEID